MNNMPKQAKNVKFRRKIDVKKTGKALLAMWLIGVVLLIGTSCHSDEETSETSYYDEVSVDAPYHEKDTNSDGMFSGREFGEYPDPPLKSQEEIEENGLTAEEVLEAYDLMALKAFQLYYGDKVYRDDLGEKWYDLSTQFISISTNTYFNSDLNGEIIVPYPIYYCQEIAKPVHKWFLTELLPESDTYHDCYATSFNAAVEYGAGKKKHIYDNFYLPSDAFESIMDAFHVESFIIDEKYIDSQDFHSMYNPRFFHSEDIGRKAYRSFEITRDMIKTANQEQLKALYLAVKTFRDINFGPNLPES